MLPLPFDHPDAGLQQLGVYGYPAQRSRHALLQVVDGGQARRWLAALLQGGWLTLATVGDRAGSAAARRAPGHGAALNLGWSHTGLRALGLAPALLRVLQHKAPAFSQGAVQRAARRLGDSGDNASPHWEPGFGTDQAHLLLSLHADTAQALQARWQGLQALDGAAALAGWERPPHDAAHLVTSAQRVVHFGYRDSLTNPRIAGLHRAGRHGLGELLLGYDTDDGDNPWHLSDQPLAAAFLRNASFGALRKIAQDEPAFRAFVARSAAAQGVDPAWIMAKLCGRWPDGRLLLPDGVAPPGGSNPNGGDGADGDFSFAHDPRGEGCPFGAHIRRMNPRGDGLAQRRQRPLMRRGMPYGPAWDGRPGGAAQPRGLVGLFFCASLEDQFEHLLGEWANKNPMGPDNRGNAKDPLIGQHDNPAATLHWPAAAGLPARRLGGLTPFVSTRGTAYLLYLTAPALAALATGAAGVIAA